jgi:putative ABC transport system ATP-binding protein
MIQLQKVSRAYRQGGQTVHALREVDLHIQGPGFYALMGPSGSGKTTLMHLMAGLDKPDTGQVIVDGMDLAKANDTQLTQFRRRRLGIVFQKFNLIPTLTAAQNVALPGVLDGQNSRWIKKRVDETLGALGLSKRASHRPDALSGGEQQRVAIARALLFDPPVLMADEPTGSLDSANSQQIWSLLSQLAKEQNKTVVMVTHEAAAAACCQEVVVLGDGLIRGRFNVEVHDAGDVASRYQQFGR